MRRLAVHGDELKRLLWLAGLVFLLAGCTLGSQLVVNPDGSGTYATTLTASGAAGNSLFNAVQQVSQTSGVPMKISRASGGGETGVTMSFGFKSLQDFAAISAKLGSATGTGLGGVTFNRGSTGWTFSANVPGGLTSPAGDSQTGSPGGLIDTSKLGALVHMSVAVTLPGSPGPNNATAVTHSATTTTFEWSLPVGRTAGALDAATAFVGNQGSVPLSTALTTLRSGPRSGHSSSSTATILVVVFVVLGVLILAAAAVFVRRRRVSQPVAAEPAGSTSGSDE